MTIRSGSNSTKYRESIVLTKHGVGFVIVTVANRQRITQLESSFIMHGTDDILLYHDCYQINDS